MFYEFVCKNFYSNILEFAIIPNNQNLIFQQIYDLENMM